MRNVIASLIIVLGLIACNAVKQVLKDPAKVEVVGREWEKTNPCTNDTILKSISDTLIGYDTSVMYVDRIVSDSDTLFLPGRDKQTIVTKTIRIRDSIQVVVTDNRRLDIAKDSIAYYKGREQYWKGQYDLQVEQTKQERKRGNKWLWLFIALSVVSVGSHFLRSKLKL